MIHPLLCNAKSNFYPRSPCGERQVVLFVHFCDITISIHALLAESDGILPHNSRKIVKFLSTLSLRRATHQKEEKYNPSNISIHALLAESDVLRKVPLLGIKYFYPRSPCGERLRHCTTYLNCSRFLSTLSLRRATISARRGARESIISIHALLAESDY